MSSDFKNDIHPKSWLSKYRQTSFTYLVKIALFYSVVGLAAGYFAYGIQYLVFGYEEPSFDFSLVTAITAGPIEETLFFGIPFSITGNHYVVLVTGALWSSFHLLNSQELAFQGFLANSNFVFTIPHIFWSIRTWKSRKGWFAIFFHSSWNAGIFGVAVLIGEIPFTIIGTEELGTIVDISFVILAAILIAITYPLYRWRIKRESKKEL